jgi:PAS domain S-box-containing protein
MIISLLLSDNLRNNEKFFTENLANSEMRVTYIDKGGKVIYDSTINGETMDNHNDRQEIIEARKSGSGFTMRYSKSVNKNIELNQLTWDKLKAQNELLNDELGLKSQILDSATDSIFLHDLDGNFIYLNETAYKSRGYTKEELMGMNLHDLDIPEYAELIKPRIKEIMEKGETTFESANFRKDMSVMPTEVHARIIESEGKNLVLSVVRDISDRKNAEEALKKAYDELERRVDERTDELLESNKRLKQEIAERKHSEERFKIIFEYAPDGYYLNDMKANLVDANKAAERLTGYKKEEVMGKNLMQLKLLPLKEVPRVSAILVRNTMGLSTGPDEFVLNRKDGSQIVIEAMTFPVKINSQKLVLGSIRDITKRRKAENALRESESKFRSIVEQSYNGITLSDENGRIIEWNNAQERITGLKRDEVIGQYLWDMSFNMAPERLRTPSAYEHLKSATFNILKTGKLSWPNQVMEREIIRPDGTYRFIETLVFTIKTDEGFMACSIATDITERKKAEKALKASEESLRRTFDQSPIGAAIVSLDYQFLRVNNELCRITGYSEEELLSLTFEDITFHEDLEHDIEQAELLKSGEIDQYQMDKRYIRKDGEVVWVRISVRMVKDVSGNPLYFLPMIEDINERKRMEDEIKASLKEKETLLREIHHRVKNNMQIINSLLSLQEGYIKDKESIELFRDTQNRVRSMAMVHEKLYQSKNLARINFAEYIYSLISEILSSYKVNPDIIKIKKDVENLFFGIDAAIPLALITNELIINSLKHAFPNGRKGEISISIQSYNGKIILVISDNGAGIPLNIDFKNTDTLGLQLVNNLTEQLDGEIELERNNGTTFRITFPQIENTET